MNTYPHSSQTHGGRLPGRTTAIATCLLIVTLLLPGGAGWTAQAAPPAQEAPPSRLPYDGPFDLPQLEGAAPRIEAAPALTAPEYVSWSKLVFQSARNENDWEIYSARGDGSNQANISNHGSMDIHPRLNRGATRVVFASNRHGGYDLFTMNPDGGGQTQIVGSAGDDVYPGLVARRQPHRLSSLPRRPGGDLRCQRRRQRPDPPDQPRRLRRPASLVARRQPDCLRAPGVGRVPHLGHERRRQQPAAPVEPALQRRTRPGRPTAARSPTTRTATATAGRRSG